MSKQNGAKSYANNVLGEARKPEFSSVSDVPWADIDKSLGAFIRSYNLAQDKDVDPDAQVADLPAGARSWMAGHTLLGDPDADNLRDLLFFPVVAPQTNSLNKGALLAVIGGRGSQADIPEDAKASAQGVARRLLAEHFDVTENTETINMRYQVAVNTHTTGKFSTLTINGRPHILTDMVPIVGDSVMNAIMYPDAAVNESFEQLNHLPAPNGHPKVDGENVSAFHPLATNAHNIGGFVRNPTKAGPEVHAQFCLDMDVAKTSADGKELVQRIKSGGKVGVSTGLTLALKAKKGKGADGTPFDAIGSDIQFDHVAVLLNEDAAGQHVGTELKLNEAGDIPAPVDGAVFVCNVIETEPEPDVQPEPEAHTQETNEMEVDEAKSFLEEKGYRVINDDSLVLIPKEEHEALSGIKAERDARINEKRVQLVEASDFSEEDVEPMNEPALDKLIALNKAEPTEPEPTTVDNSLRPGGGMPKGSEDEEATRALINSAFEGTYAPKKKD